MRILNDQAPPRPGPAQIRAVQVCTWRADGRGLADCARPGTITRGVEARIFLTWRLVIQRPSNLPGPREQDAETTEERELAAKRVDGLLRDYTESARAKEVETEARVRGVQMQSRSLGSSAGLGTQMAVLTRRSFSNMLRNRLLLRAKFGQSIFMALLVGLIFRALKATQQSIQDRTGALFFISVNMTMTAMFSVLSSFGNERTVFERERSVGMYSTLTYFWSKILVELPMNIVFPFIQGTIAYWLVGLQNDAGKYLFWSLTVILLNNVGTAFGITIACTFKSLEVTLAVAPLFILPLMLFSGMFVSANGIPPYFDWIKWFSPMKYSFAAFMINEYSGLAMTCEADEWVARPDCPREMENGVAKMLDGAPVFKKCFCPVTDGKQARACARRRATALRSSAPQRLQAAPEARLRTDPASARQELPRSLCRAADLHGAGPGARLDGIHRRRLGPEHVGERRGSHPARHSRPPRRAARVGEAPLEVARREKAARQARR
jgi:ABC-type multidrug transport system permease subunit